jgi:hypothetical protein
MKELVDPSRKTDPYQPWRRALRRCRATDRRGKAELSDYQRAKSLGVYWR